jgi:hypothetical protein
MGNDVLYNARYHSSASVCSGLPGINNGIKFFKDVHIHTHGGGKTYPLTLVCPGERQNWRMHKLNLNSALVVMGNTARNCLDLNSPDSCQILSSILSTAPVTTCQR